MSTSTGMVQVTTAYYRPEGEDRRRRNHASKKICNRVTSDERFSTVEGVRWHFWLVSNADRMISAETPTLKTFGADVGAISYFVFGEDQPSRLAQEVETKIMAHTASWEEIFETYKDRVSLDLLGEIRARVEGTDREADGQ